MMFESRKHILTLLRVRICILTYSHPSKGENMFLGFERARPISRFWICQTSKSTGPNVLFIWKWKWENRLKSSAGTFCLLHTGMYGTGSSVAKTLRSGLRRLERRGLFFRLLVGKFLFQAEQRNYGSLIVLRFVYRSTRSDQRASEPGANWAKISQVGQAAWLHEKRELRRYLEGTWGFVV